jgi:hypothetical protein
MNHGASRGYGGHYSWLVPILPFVELDNLYSQFDLSINNGDGNEDFMMSDDHLTLLPLRQRCHCFYARRMLHLATIACGWVHQILPPAITWETLAGHRTPLDSNVNEGL